MILKDLSKIILVFLDNRHLGKIYFLRIYYKMYRSYAITVRPRDGISDTTISAYLKWFEKLDYAFVCTEKEGVERHLHAQIWTDQPKAKGDIVKQVERICERTINDWDQAQKKVLRQGVKIGYSDWYLDYLAENELKDILCDILYQQPPENTYPYYPTEEEQEKVKNTANAVDPRFTDLEYKCNDYLTNKDLTLTHKSVARFLCDAMFNTRSIKVLMHQRDRTALATALYAFMSKSTNVDLFINKTAEEKKQDLKFEAMKQHFAEFNLSDDDED